MVTAICSVCKTDQPISPDGNWIVVHPDSKAVHQCPGSGYPPFVDIEPKPLTLVEKQQLLSSIENDFWALLKKKNDDDAEYPEVATLIQSINNCQNMWLFWFPDR